SGSMKGRFIEKALKTLQFLLLSLPKTCLFNVISIGHKNFKNLFEKSRECTNENIAVAIKEVQKITAKGGTHIYEALEWVLKYSLSDMPTSVFLFSDFETSNIGIVKLIKDYQEKKEKKNNLRIFSIGMNDSISHHFIESMVRAGNGYAEYVSNSEQMNRKAMIMLRNSLNPTKDYDEIIWTDKEPQNSSIKFQQVPLKIPELYVGVRFIIYCILPKDVKPCKQITIKSKSQDILS
ncbi:9815_t:CDS:1, partial [Scutellospora calospora]